MKEWRLSLLAVALSLASSSIAAVAQVQGQYGGGFSLKLPLGDGGSAPAIRPWAHGDGAAGSSSSFVGSDAGISSNTGGTSSTGSAPSGGAGASGALGAIGSTGGTALGGALSGIKKP
jgi:hypothetical protein